MKYYREIIEWSEGGDEPAESPLLTAFQKLSVGAPDKFIAAVTQMKEFFEPKVQIANYQANDEPLSEIKITIVKNERQIKKKDID